MSRYISKWEKSLKTDPKNDSAVADRPILRAAERVQSGKLKRRAYWPALLLLLAACTMPPESPSSPPAPPPAQDSAVAWPIKSPPPVHKPKPAGRANPASTGKAEETPPAAPPAPPPAPPPLPPCLDVAASKKKQILQMLDCIRIEQAKPDGTISNGN